MTQTGQAGGTTAIYIRGGNNGTTKVLIDGVPMNDMGGTVELADLSSSFLSKAEILRGPNSSVYGVDAMAGVVSLSTQSGVTRLPELTYTVDGGNFASYRQQASIGGKWKTADYFNGFSRYDSANSLPNNRFHSSTAVGNYGWHPTGNSSLRATVHHDQQMSGQPNAILLYGIADNARQYNEDSFFGASFETQITPNWQGLLRYTGTRLRSTYTEYSATGIFDSQAWAYLGKEMTIRGANGYSVTGQAIFQYVEDYPYNSSASTDRDAYEAQTSWRIFPQLLGLISARYEDARGYAYSSPSYYYPVKRRNSDYAAMLQGSVKGRLFYTAGTGIENSELYGVAATPRASLAWIARTPAESKYLGITRLHGSFGKGIKEPTIYQQTGSLYNDVLQYMSNAAEVIADDHISQIGPEWSRTFDGGVEQEFLNGRGRLNLTWFHNEFSHSVEYVPTEGLEKLGIDATTAETLYGAYVNSLSFRAQGVESEARLLLGHGVDLSGGYTYLDAIVQNSFSSDAIGAATNSNFPNILIGAYSPLKGARPFRRAPHTGYFGISYTQPKFSAMLTGTVVGHRDDSDFLSDSSYGDSMLLPNRNLLGAYQRLDFNSRYTINSHLELTARVQNLLSEHYSEAFGYPAQPLTFRTGIQVRFGGESWKLR